VGEEEGMFYKTDTSLEWKRSEVSNRFCSSNDLGDFLTSWIHFRQVL